jgi:SAM-dependent methyltransferase
VRCAVCGLRFANPQPSDEELDAIYDAGYYSAFGFDTGGGLAYRHMKRARFDRLLECVEAYCAPHRLLDVGSGLGDLLSVATRRGWEAIGVEPNPFAAQIAEQFVAATTLCASIEQACLRQESFDVVTCADVLEHLRRPDRMLREAARLLRPGGLTLITTVDVESRTARALRQRWPHYHRDHLWYFSRATLRRLVTASGFDVLVCCRAKKVFALRYILEILAHATNLRIARRIARLALRSCPRRLLDCLFTMREGILLIARKPEVPSPANSDFAAQGPQ